VPADIRITMAERRRRQAYGGRYKEKVRRDRESKIRK
jgi:hypothetical protein